MNKDKSVQGFALYLEFQKDESVDNRIAQIFLVPVGYDENDKLVGQRILWRVVSNVEPKKQWRSLHSLSASQTKELAENFDVKNLLNSSWGSNWVLSPFQWVKSSNYSAKKAVYIEVSKKDYTDLGNSKTPTKLIYRMNQIRSVSGLAEIGVK